MKIWKERSRSALGPVYIACHIHADPVIALSASVCIKILNLNHKKSPKNDIISSTGENGTTNLVRTIAIHNPNSPICLFVF